MLISTVNQILSVVIIASQIFLVAGVVYFFLFRKSENNPLISFFGKYGMLLALLVVLGSIAASLFYSNYAGFAPCVLCWWQRIAMYPLVILLGMGLYRRDTNIIDYALTLSLIGAAIALYQNYLGWGGTSLFPCDALGIAVSCTKRYVFEFGYITIPMMALTGFALITAFLSVQRYYLKNGNRISH